MAVVSLAAFIARLTEFGTLAPTDGGIPDAGGGVDSSGVSLFGGDGAVQLIFEEAGADAPDALVWPDAPTNDAGYATDSCSGVPDGHYCGGGQVEGDSVTLFTCQGGKLQMAQLCPNSCTLTRGGGGTCQ